MAYSTGTVADSASFRTALFAFMVAQGWAQVWASSDSKQVVMEGPGLTGVANVYVGFRFQDDPANDSYIVFMRGLTGVTPSEPTLATHPGASDHEVAFYTDANPMQYWFMVNDRRVLICLKISTTYQTAYAGFFLPYALPTNYPSPYLLAGTRGQFEQGLQTWRSTDVYHTSMLNPTGGDVNSGLTASAFMRDPLGVWLPVANIGNISNRHASMLPLNGGNLGFPTEVMPNPDGDIYGDALGYRASLGRMRPALGGVYPLIPLTLASSAPDISSATENETWGVLDGVYFTCAFGNSSENTITVDGVTHQVVQNIFRSGQQDYLAIAQQ